MLGPEQLHLSIWDLNLALMQILEKCFFLHKRESGSHLSGHGVSVKDREDQSEDGSIEETKVRLEDDAVEGRGGRCQEVHLVQLCKARYKLI